MYERFDIRRVGYKVESLFGTTPADPWIYLRTWGDVPQAMVEMLQNKAFRSGMYRNEKLQGRDNATFSMNTYFQSRGSGTSVMTALLTALMGGVSDKNAQSTTVSAKIDAVSLKVATGTLLVAAGDHIGVAMDTGIYEIVEVASLAVDAGGDTVVFWPALSSTAYTVGNAVRGCRTYYASGGPAGSFSLQIEGENADDCVVFRGCKADAKISFDPSAADPFPIITWAWSAQKSLSTGVAAPAYVPDDQVAPPQLENMKLFLGGYTAPQVRVGTYSNSVFSKAEIDVGWDLKKRSDATATNGIGDWIAVPGEKLFTGSLSLPWQILLEQDLRASTRRSFLLRWGDGPLTGAGAVSIPSIGFDTVKKVSLDGINWADITLGSAREHTDYHAATPLDKSGMRLVMLG